MLRRLCSFLRLWRASIRLRVKGAAALKSWTACTGCPATELAKLEQPRQVSSIRTFIRESIFSEPRHAPVGVIGACPALSLWFLLTGIPSVQAEQSTFS